MTDIYFSVKKTLEEIKEGRKNIKYLGYPEDVKSDTIKTITLTQVDTYEGTEEYLIVFDIHFSRTAAILVENEFERQEPDDEFEINDIIDYDGKYHTALNWKHKIKN